MSLKSPRFQ